VASVVYMPRSSLLQREKKKKKFHSKYSTESISDTRTHKVTSNLMGPIDYGCWFSAVVCKSLRDNWNCALLDCRAASSGNSLPTFRGNLSGPVFKGQESKT